MQQQPSGDDEGVVRITAHRRANRIVRTTVAIPGAAAQSRRLVGLDPAAAVNTLATLATHSPRAHALALGQACAAAQGNAAHDHATLVAIERELAAEAADTHLRRLLIEWPQALGHDARHTRYNEFHRRLTTKTDPASCFELGGDVLDLVAREMLAGFFNRIRMPHNLAEFIERADTGSILGAVLRDMIELGPSQPSAGRGVAILGTQTAAAWVATIGTWPSDEFVAHPTFAGEPAETGPLARHAASPLVRLLLDRGHRLSARLFSKIIDLADCASRMRYPLTDDVPPLLDASAAGPGVGMARVSTARGVLLCWVRMEGGCIADCRIVPAAAWNFHPEGAFCREACSSIDETPEAALRRLSLLALALDPSVPYRIELVEEAGKSRKRA